jgi:hypothetical protein
MNGNPHLYLRIEITMAIRISTMSEITINYFYIHCIVILLVIIILFYTKNLNKKILYY